MARRTASFLSSSTAHLPGTPSSRVPILRPMPDYRPVSEEHTSELQSRRDLVCRLLLEKKKKPGFHAEIAIAPEGNWVGTVPSPYGEHLVRLDARRHGAPAVAAGVPRQAALVLVAARAA